MLEQLIHLLLLVLASMLVMILHELPKAMIFTKLFKRKHSTYKSNIYAFHQYIDPIGLIFCITNFAGFSKPYVYRLNDKKMNKVLSVTGFVSLIIVFSISMSILNIMNIRTNFLSLENISSLVIFSYSFFVYIARISIGMFLVNLFPLATFDMGQFIASRSLEKYYSLLSKDYFIKMILMLVILFGIISNLTAVIISLFLFL